MMPKGTIVRVIEYYTESEKFESEITRALLEFFDLDDMAEFEKVEQNDFTDGLINEWLVYDFRLDNNKSLLEDFYIRNPFDLPFADLAIYRDLQKTNIYGFFEVISVDIGNGLRLRDLSSGKKYDVRERSATYDLKPGHLFYNRLAFLDDCWQLVGANSPCLPVAISVRLRQCFLDKKAKRFTPKDAYKFTTNRREDNFEEIMVDPAQARRHLQELLEIYGLSQFVSTQTIFKWCRTDENTNKAFEIMSLIYGLCHERVKSEDLDKLIRAIQDFYNTVPQKSLGGKSPLEKFQEDPDRVPEFISDIQSLGGEKWLGKVDSAQKLMRSGDYCRAAVAFGEVFSALLEEKTTRPDIYRLYANKAVCHFACGQEAFGRKMLDLSLALNSKYDFAIGQKEKYGRGDFDLSFVVDRIKSVVEKKSVARELKSDPAVLYYNYIKKLGINFETKEVTTSKITVFGTKMKRNDKGYSGSRKKFKKCHGI